METVSLINALSQSPIVLGGAISVITLKLILDFFKVRENLHNVREAEKKAFDESFSVEEKVKSLYESHDGLREKTEEIRKIVEESQNAIVMGRLSNLYTQQIEKYQQETRSRAGWSFIFAIISMFLGMVFLFWGGSFILSEAGAEHVAAGASISAIGGGISAFITKTFLDVHKLSLTQLNRYFQQPVINDHIMTAQRLAEDVENEDVRTASYEKLISSITAMIDSKNNNDKGS